MRLPLAVGVGLLFLACGGSDASGPFQGSGGESGDKGAAGASTGSAGSNGSAGATTGSAGDGSEIGGGGGSSGAGGSSSAADASAGSGGAGTGVHDASTEQKAGDSGISCGTKVCEGGQYCCNASCSICAPKGAVCIQMVCNQEGFGKGCTATPAQDARCDGKPPHYVRCVFPYEQASGCVQVLVGNATDGYCCP